MTPNAVDSTNNEIESVSDNRKEMNMSIKNYAMKTSASLFNLVAYVLIGVTVGTSLAFAFANGLPLGATRLHIVLCVIGYQLLMALAILSLSPTSWVGYLSLRDKRRAHTVLQVAGSGLALAGCFIKIIDKQVNFNTLHGKLALVAMVFTSVSLVNGLSSLYAFEWRRCLPGNLSKLTHICFGIVAFGSSSIALCYGFDKSFFRAWATEGFTTTLICFTGIFTFIIIFNPILTFFSKTKRILLK